MVLALLRQLRYQHPRMGLRKLYHLMLPQLRSWGLSVGRDRLFSLARKYDLLAFAYNPKRSYQTTYPGRLRHPNLLAQRPPTLPGQALAADITYLFTQKGHRYLFLVMDVYSRFLLGWHLADSLVAKGALLALGRALERERMRQPSGQAPGQGRQTPGQGNKQKPGRRGKRRSKQENERPTKPFQGVIHHSDHGVQYASRAYQEFLAREGLLPSMGRLGNAYDNARMERAIGTLKREYGIEGPFPTEKDALLAVKEAIRLYNHERPHWALALATPAQVHFGSGSWEGKCVNI